MKTLPVALRAVIICAYVAAVAPAPAAEDNAANVEKSESSRVVKQRAAPDSLMFTPDEFADIQGHSAGGGSVSSGAGDGGGHQAIEDATLYLSTIVYAGPDDWTIWINGAPVSSNQGFQAFKVTEITPNSVDLLVPLSAQGVRPVHLQPNQTFITKTGVVVEGKYP